MNKNVNFFSIFCGINDWKLGIGLYSIYYFWGRFIILVFKVIISYKFILLVVYLILVIFCIGGGMIFLFVMKYFVW